MNTALFEDSLADDSRDLGGGGGGGGPQEVGLFCLIPSDMNCQIFYLISPSDDRLIFIMYIFIQGKIDGLAQEACT